MSDPIYMVKQLEKHFGPHAPWFWDVDRSGGGVFMDMGCHGIAFCYWFLGRPKIKSVLCHLGTYVHGDKTRGDDEALQVAGRDPDTRRDIGGGRRGCDR